MNNKIKDSLDLMFNTEAELRNALIEVLKSKGFNPLLEIPFLGRSLDVVYRNNSKTITVVEVKRLPKHIYRALNQAKICLLGTDKVYVCTLRYKISENVKSAFRKLGVGLIFLEQESGGFSLHYEVPAGSISIKRKEYTTLLNKAIAQKQEEV